MYNRVNYSQHGCEPHSVTSGLQTMNQIVSDFGKIMEKFSTRADECAYRLTQVEADCEAFQDLISEMEEKIDTLEEEIAANREQIQYFLDKEEANINWNSRVHKQIKKEEEK